MIRFVVPGQPQGKQRPRIGRVGAHARMFTPTKTVDYEALVARQARAASIDMLSGPIAVRLLIACRMPRAWSQKRRHQAAAGEFFPAAKPDIDNVAKAILDGLNGIAWFDDSQVVDLVLVKRYAEVPRVEVEITPLAPLSAAIPKSSFIEECSVSEQVSNEVSKT